ncbi:MAG: hypothetical protein KIS79_18260, partial [Burkholderiales bacterium]|nr:hypothetical protein [Burkholderiales bacterium]
PLHVVVVDVSPSIKIASVAHAIVVQSFPRETRSGCNAIRGQRRQRHCRWLQATPAALTARGR